MARSLPSNTPFTLLLIILLCTCSLAHLDRFESTILNQNNTQNTNSNEVNFTAAGSDKISIIGQPIHLGDYVHASILIHNQGDIRDSVRLVVEGIDDSIWFGEYVEILVQVGKSLSHYCLQKLEIMNLTGVYIVPEGE